MSQYSNTLRKRVLDEVDKKTPREKIAKMFGIHLNTVKNWIKLRKIGLASDKLDTWKTKPRPTKGPKYLNLETLRQYVKNNPDAYLEEIAEALGSNDSTISYWCIKLNLTRKKNRRFT